MRTRSPAAASVSTAALPPLIAIAIRAVRVLVEDQIAVAGVGVGVGDDGVVRVQREPQLDAVAPLEAEGVDLVPS